MLLYIDFSVNYKNKFFEELQLANKHILLPSNLTFCCKFTSIKLQCIMNYKFSN